MKKLDTDSYKGVRDFYPEEMWVRKWMFGKLRETVQKYGFVEYDASILEPADLYTAKSGEEIVNEQTYTFEDRGGRRVTLRPEMTPTVARMVAAKRRELGFPVRWYSIPNLFRYEAPQRGRLREHWQLNVDIFGTKDISADIEVVRIGSEILTQFGATANDFVIKINSRPLLTAIFEYFDIPEENRQKVTKLLDKKEKTDPEVWNVALAEIIPKQANEFIELFQNKKRLLETIGEDNAAVKEIIQVIDSLMTLGVNNVEFTPTLTRGFDYYTGIIFEFFDTNPENKRSLFGGGRYDNLTELFDNEAIPAVGFGMGDVTLKDFLVSRKLIPEYISETAVCVGTLSDTSENNALQLIEKLRNEGLNISACGTKKNRGDIFKVAERNRIPFTLIIDKAEEKMIEVTHTWKEGLSKSFGIENYQDIKNFIKDER